MIGSGLDNSSDPDDPKAGGVMSNLRNWPLEEAADPTSENGEDSLV